MRIIALPGEKGGIGKTTTTVNLGAALVEMGRRVLLLDTDPQMSCSRSVGVVVSDPARSLYAALSGQASLIDLIVKSPTCDIFVVPAHRRLATIGVEITVHPDTRLRKALSVLPQDAYDYVLIDCPPRLDLLPINAITAAGELLIPLTLEVLPTHTLPTLMRTINEVRTFGDNPGLRVLGIVPCMTTRGRTRLEREIRRVLPQLVDVPVYSGIRKAEVIRQAPGRRLPVILHAPRHPAAEDYRRLAREVDWGLETAQAWEQQRDRQSDPPAPVGSSKAQPGSPGFDLTEGAPESGAVPPAHPRAASMVEIGAMAG
ncbi:MAG: ParA family protein [Chloroflexota bacterium]|nr:ParA family protein [Chloroflexota bacterium]